MANRDAALAKWVNSVQPHSDEPRLSETGSLSSDTTFYFVVPCRFWLGHSW